MPPGSRLSPSAVDLIRDYGARVVYVDPARAPQEAAPAKPAPSKAPPAEVKPKASPEDSALRETLSGGLPGEASPEDVEKILERVLVQAGPGQGRDL